MKVCVIGLSHKTAPVEQREKLLAAINATPLPFPHVLLTTCNRCEVYADTGSLESLKRHIGNDFSLYTHVDEACFAHLAEVTAGLDSAAFGETEIQGQVKLAYAKAALTHTLTTDLHRLFQRSLHLGKTIRNNRPATIPTDNLETTLYSLCNFAKLKKRLFFVGNSEINRKLIAYFQKRGVEEIALCSRSADTPLEAWQDYEIVICATTASHFLLTANQIRPASRTQLILDLGMPRNVDPALRHHLEFALFNIDEIGRFMAHKTQEQLAYLSAAKHQIEQSTLRVFSS